MPGKKRTRNAGLSVFALNVEREYRQRFSMWTVQALPSMSDREFHELTQWINSFRYTGARRRKGSAVRRPKNEFLRYCDGNNLTETETHD